MVINDYLLKIIFVEFKRKRLFETEEFLSEQSFDESIFEADGNFC